MSVVGGRTIVKRQWRGYDNPSLPIGNYYCWATVLGDASGGTNTISIEYHPESQAAVTTFYSIEALELFTGQAADVRANMIAINFSGRLVEGAAANRQWTIFMDNHANGGAAALIDQGLKRPIFLGTPTQPNQRASLSIVTSNSNGDSVQIWIEGYIWDGRSMMAEGGLQRPLQSLYG